MEQSNPTVTFVKQEEEQLSNGQNHPMIPLLSTTYDLHNDMHWSFCQDPYCTTHLHAKQNNNYFPGMVTASQNQQHCNQHCDCGMMHDPELDAVIRAKHLNVRKACRAWGKGKRVCYDCGFLVNLDGHEERCSVANQTRSSPPDIRMDEAPVPAGEDRHHHYEQYLRGGHDEEAEEREKTISTELPDVLVPAIAIPEGITVNLSLSQQVIGDTQGAGIGALQHRDYDSAHLERMVREVCYITQQQWEVAQQISEQCRYEIQRSVLRGCTSLVGALAWRGELLSQTTRAMLLGAVIAIAGLWIITITMAMGYATLRK
jgi:hypothetical protein